VRSPGRALAAAAAATAIAIAAIAEPSAAGASTAAPRTSLPVIERQVMCVTCKIPLNVAQSAQADRERAEKRAAAETARLPVIALDQPRTMAPPAPPRRTASTCQEINARAQLGDISDADRDTLKRGCH